MSRFVQLHHHKWDIDTQQPTKGDPVYVNPDLVRTVYSWGTSDTAYLIFGPDHEVRVSENTATVLGLFDRAMGVE